MATATINRMEYAPATVRATKLSLNGKEFPVRILLPVKGRSFQSIEYTGRRPAIGSDSEGDMP